MKNFTAYHLLKSFNKGANNPNNIELHNVENSPGGGVKDIKLKIFIDTNLQHLKSISHELIILIKDSKNKNIKLYHDAEIDPNIVRSMYDKLFIKKSFI